MKTLQKYIIQMVANLNLNTNKVSPKGGLRKRYAEAMGMQANLLPEISLAEYRTSGCFGKYRRR